MRLLRLAPLLLLAAPAFAGPNGDYAAGEAAFAEGDPRAARSALEQALRANPADGAAHLLQGEVSLALGDGAGAEAELRRAQSDSIPAASLHHLLAEALLLEGKPDLALTEIAATPARYAADAARLRGRAFAALGRGDEAPAAFDVAIQLAPTSVAAWTDLAGFRKDVGDLAGAGAAIDRALAIDPGHERWRRAPALVLKGRLVRVSYGLAASLPWFDRALRVDKGNAPALVERAATLGDLGRAREALAASRAVIALGGNDTAGFYIQAVIAARAKDWRLARVLLDHAGEAVSAQPGGMLVAGTVELANGNVEQAIDWFAQLVSLQPANAKAHRLLALAQWRAGDWDATLAALRPIVDGPNADSYSLTLAGRALERMGDRAGAAAYLDRAARPGATPPPAPADDGEAAREAAWDPRDADAQFASLTSLFAARRGAEALAQAQRIAALQPGSADAFIAMGDVLAALGRPADAAAAYSHAASFGFTAPVALRTIDALRQAGRSAEAGRVLNALLWQYPHSIAGRLLAADGATNAGEWRAASVLIEGVVARVGGNDPNLLSALAWTRVHDGRLDDGLAAAFAARRIAPANPVANDMLGWLLWRSGRDRAQGRALIEEAARQAPDNRGIAAHLAAARGG